LKKVWEHIIWSHNLASKAEKQCKGLWTLFGLAFAAGVVFQSFVLFSVFSKLNMVNGIAFVLLSIAYLWSFWLEVGLTAYRARSYILNQVDTLIQGIAVMEKKDDNRPTVH